MCGLQNCFFSALRVLVWSKNKEGALAPPLDPTLYDSFKIFFPFGLALVLQLIPCNQLALTIFVEDESKIPSIQQWQWHIAPI